ncbi:MAG: protein kinase [Myxococcales bacterium]|nr:protein kinase [Myxococcales bacterium]
MTRDEETAPSNPAESTEGPASASSRHESPHLRYELGELIGRGGMGEVVAATDQQIGRTVAVKRIRSNDPAAVTRFLREARVQGRLEHPAIVPVHELYWNTDSRQLCLVMKRVTGITLASVLSQLANGDPEMTRRFSRQQLLRAFVDVCLAIEFAHTRGVVHRDVKPGNIMLGDFGEVYVLDWGIARIVGDLSGSAEMSDLAPVDASADTTVTRGTPGYMSPEQIRGDATVDQRADVYSLGATLFHILSLEPLHPHEAGLDAALTGTDARPSQRAPDRGIPPELDAVCVEATALDRADRIGSARELAARVERYLDGDRDLATRAKLAQAALEDAHAALARGNGAADRRAAIRAAARALALDPSSREPAELVGRLMIEPPVEMPDEVERELEAIDQKDLKVQGQLGTFSMLAYLLFFPLMYAAGFRHLWYLIAGPALVAGVIVGSRHVAKTGSLRAAYACFVINLVLVALFARIATPFLVAPGLAAMTVMVYATHVPMGRAWVLFTATLAAVLGPWIAEIAGVISTTTSITGGSFQLQAAADSLAPTLTLISLGLFVAGLLGMATMLARTLSLSRRETQRTLQLQAWQLRQLMA